MIFKNIIFIKITLITFLIQVFCKNPVFTINGKKLLHISDATFLSYIVDYTSTVEFIAKGFSSTQLAQTLSPSTIRITDAFSSIISSNLTIQQWNSINDWFLRSNLNPIYVIDSQVTNQSTALLPYLKTNHVFWELHYDCGNASENILLTVRELLNSYPELISNLKIVQSNLSFCFSDQNRELLHDKLIKELNYSIDIVTYEERFNMNETKAVKSLVDTKTKIPIWVKLETQNETLSFEETLIWFNAVEKFGRNGFAAVFRQSKWDELIADNPLYWITMIYKSLVSPKILDTRSSKSRDLDLNVYAHCTNNENRFSSDDSMVIIATNCDSRHQNFSMRITPPHLKSIEVLSYIVTSDESISTFVNGEKLTFESIFNNHTLKPEARTVRVINHMVPLSLSANSIGFFIINTKVSACINKTSKFEENLIKQNGDSNSEEIPSNNSDLATKTLNLEIVYVEQPHEEISPSVKKIELKLTDDEIKQILLNRAKAKANELNLTITSEEIDNEILREVGNVTKIEENRPKRDINMKELKKHTSKMQVNPATYGNFGKKKLPDYHVPKGRYADYDEEDVTERYIEDNIKFLMGPNHPIEKSSGSLEEDHHQMWNSDSDDKNVRNAVRLLEDYMEQARSSEETDNSYGNYNKYGRRFKRSSDDDEAGKFKRTHKNGSKDFKTRRLNKYKRRNTVVPKIEKGFRIKNSSKNLKKRDKRSMGDLVNSMENEIEEDSILEFKKGVPLEIIPTHITFSTIEETQTNSNLQNAKFNETNRNNTIIVVAMEPNNYNYFEIISEHIRDFYNHIYNLVANLFT